MDDVRNCLTMDAKRAGSALVLVGETSCLGGSIYADMYQPHRASELPEFELDRLVRTARCPPPFGPDW